MSAKLSLCMIVRDEAATLPAFLRAAEGLYDELCVVDTGSRDGTQALLAAAGARLIERPWDDDFAAARNAGLALARHPWVLYLDADEQVSPGLGAELRATLADPEAGAATVPIRNALPHGHVAVSHQLRLFRRDPAIRFTHRVHEDAVGSVLAMLRRRGLHLRGLRGVVEHTGYVRTHAAGRDKKARDLRLLRRCLEDHPDDLYSWHKLLGVARFWGDAALLADEATGAAHALTMASPEALRAGHFLGEMLTMLADGLVGERSADQLAFFDTWGPQVPPSAALHLRCGENYERLGQMEEAIRCFQRCLELAEITPNRQLATTRPTLGLARVGLAGGHTEAALALLHHALAQSPRDPEALLAVATISRRLGGTAACARIAAAYVDAYGDAPELHGALGEAALRADDLEAAVRELRQAVDAQRLGGAAAFAARRDGEAGEAGEAGEDDDGDLPYAALLHEATARAAASAG